MSPLKSIFPAMALLATHLAAAQPSLMVGEWVSYSNGGLYASPDGKCVGRSIEERRYVITRAANDLVATYASVWHLRWMRLQDPDCAFPGLPPKQAYIGHRAWFVEMARLADQSYAVSATYKGCKGDVCTLDNLYQSPFTTTLVARDGQLLDIAQDSKDRKDQAARIFEPLAKAQRDATATATAFMAQWRAMPDDDTALAHVRPLLGPDFKDDEQARRVLRQYHVTQLANSAGYRLIEAYELAPSPNGWPQNTRVLIFSVGNDQLNGQRLGETYELAYLDGAWKLLDLRF